MSKSNFNPNKIYLLFLLISQFTFAQLTDFTLSVTPQNETCLGNGTLTFSVNGITAGATVIYQVYKLPNLSAPIASLSSTTLTGLNSGDYRVVATQTLGALSNTQTQDVSIANQIISLVYNVSSIPEGCNNGQIIVNVIQGSPVLYKLKLGSVTIAAQATNTFNNLSAGSYTIIVVDNCGEELPLSYTLTKVDYFKILKFEKSCSLLSCNTLVGSLKIEVLAGMNLIYPLTVEFTSASGSPAVQSQILNSGDLLSQSVSFTVPYQLGINNYSIKVTDSCSNFKIYNDFFSVTPQLTLTKGNSCDKSFTTSACNIVLPYTLSVLSAPAGFNPSNFNSIYPGPFNTSSATFTSTTNQLPNGNYDLQITDACGRITHGQITISDTDPQFFITPTGIPCSNLSAVNSMDFNLTSVIITTSTNGFPTTLPFDASSNINSNGNFAMNLPAGTYTFVSTNACGTFTTQVVVPARLPLVQVVGSLASGCFGGTITVRIVGANLQTITIISGPSSFTVPFDATSFINISNPGEAIISNLPAGQYVLSVTDSCANLLGPYNATVGTNLNTSPPVITIANGCTDVFSSLKIQSNNGALQIVRITSAPASFNQTLPYDVSFNIDANDGSFYMNSLPIGSYTFYTKDSCAIENTQTVQVTSYLFDPNSITIQTYCGSFDVVMNYVLPINTNIHTFWLQKWNPTLNQWEHPFTNVVYTNGSLPDSTNSYELNNNSTNLNINAQGTFRILKAFDIYSNGSSTMEKCISVAKTFDFNDRLAIISAYAIPCASGSGTEVILTVQGIPPYTYKITERNGQPFVVDNGASNVFSGLQSGVYNFEVSDVCGTIVNRVFDITSLPLPTVAPNNLCSGLNGSLSVEPFSFFNYQWWKDNNTTTILSTTNVLNFNPFNNATDAGVYHVRIYSQTSISCTDRILDYTIPLNSAPNAGQNATQVVCGSQNQIDLFTVLGAHDPNGTWQEIVSNSGTLSNNIWIASGLPFGTYQFKYTVNGFCGATDDATVTLVLSDSPLAPDASVDPIVCETQVLNLYATTIANATYQWNGPNGFSSTDQNPVINNASTVANGTYSVKALIGTCESPVDTVEVLVNTSPTFILSNSCQGSSYVILAEPVNNSFDSNNVTYDWTGPNGYLSSSNPAIIPNGAIGNYQLEITNTSGCKFSDGINVLSTSCEIPNIITPNNDEFNNSFDLTGLEVQNFQVYNRWGRLVYELDNYVNEWHGQNNQNQNLPNATYYYVINFANGETKKGWILLEGI